MFHNSWDIVLKDEMEKQYFKYIKEFVKEERLSKTIYPPAKDLFNAFKLKIVPVHPVIPPLHFLPVVSFCASL